VRAEARFGIFSEQRAEEIIEIGLQIPHRDAFIHIKRFNLVKVGAVSGIRGVPPKAAAGR